MSPTTLLGEPETTIDIYGNFDGFPKNHSVFFGLVSFLMTPELSCCLLAASH